jgi:hypothetical protein
MRAATRKKYPFEQMEVGDMFFVPHLEKNTLVTHVSDVGKTLGRKFATRLTYMVWRKQQWVPATATTPKAVRGVGVWRRA